MYRYAGILLLMISCTSSRVINYTIPTVPLYKIDPSPQKIILLSVYDVSAKHYRDNKEELFQHLIDTTMEWAAQKIKSQYSIRTEVIRGYTPKAGKTDSIVHASLLAHQATHAIVINSFDVYFDQTDVEVTRGSRGNKTREAFYDIISDIGFLFYDTVALVKEKDVHRSQFHSSRSVLSGLLAAGPNIVARRNDAYRISLQSWDEFLDYFFPGERPLSRRVFVGKGFEMVRQALARKDYEAAMIESLRLVDDVDKKKAAKANYNCAVLMERKGQRDEAEKYLSRSLSLFTLDEATMMDADY